MKEFWHIITPETWSKDHIACTYEGRVVLPSDEEAKKFSIVGALRHCYLEKDQNWSLLFEQRRSLVFTAILCSPHLNHVVSKVYKYTTLSKVPLQELNRKVEYDFIATLLKEAEKNKQPI